MGVKGVLHNVHLAALPKFDRHTSENQVNLLVKVLDVVIPSWREKLIGVSTNGENANTGRIRGVVTQLEALAKHSVRILC